MKKIVFFLAAVLFLNSCGIEVYYSLEPPPTRALANPTDPAGREFSFYTNESNNPLSVFKGTAVYYRIYNNLSELNSDSASINSANAEYSSSGYNRMVSLGYQALDTTTHPNILILDTNTNQTVRIRLFDEGFNSGTNSYAFYAGFFLLPGGKLPAGELPRRRSNGKGFNFYKYTAPNLDLNDTLPAQGDSDTRWSSSPTASDTWYVNAYAVSVGQDTYLTPLYSQLLWLGYIQINK